MQLEQQFELPAPPAMAWPAFQDVAGLVECLPGASLSGPPVDGELPLRFDVKLGPIAAAFAGSGRVQFDAADHSGRFEGSATDRRTQSRVKGAATFQLQAHGSGSLVQVKVDYTLTGTLAQFGRSGIVRELANALTAQFAANLASRLGSAAAAPPAMAEAGSPNAVVNTPPTPESAASAPARPAAVPLSVFGLVLLALKSRWQQFRRRWRRAGS